MRGRAQTLGLVALLGVLACGLRADTGAAAGDMSDGESGESGMSNAQAGGSGGDNAMPAGPEIARDAWTRGVALAGAYAYALEGSAFLACGSTEYWWTEFEGLALERFQDVAFDLGCEDRGCLFAAAGQGDVSPPGRYGPSGEYARAVTFTRLTTLARTTLAPDPPSVNAVACAR